MYIHITQKKKREKWYFVTKIVLTYCEKKLFLTGVLTCRSWTVLVGDPLYVTIKKNESEESLARELSYKPLLPMHFHNLFMMVVWALWALFWIDVFFISSTLPHGVEVERWLCNPRVSSLNPSTGNLDNVVYLDGFTQKHNKDMWVRW